MTFLGRSKYNLLQYKKLENPELSVPSWQVQNYRCLTHEELFSGLQNLHPSFHPDLFYACQKQGGSLEDLLAFFPASTQEIAYLYLFELWRRLCPDQKTLAIFCDDLDAFISAYDEKNPSQDETLLQELFDILDESVDKGGKPKAVFKELCNYLAHDLESFFYNYISDRIENESALSASELLENIHDYVEGNLWFDFLQIKLLRGAPSEDATAMLARFLEKLKHHPDIELSFELLYYLIETGHKELFLKTYKDILQEITLCKDFVEMLNILLSFYALNELSDKEGRIFSLIQKYNMFPSDAKVTSEEQDKLLQLL